MSTNFDAYPFLLLVALGGNVWYFKILFVLLLVLLVPLYRIVDDKYDIALFRKEKTPP